MDLAASAQDMSNNDFAAVFFLAGANPGEFTTQAVDVPIIPPWFTFPVTGLLSGGYLKPDVALNIGNTGSDDTTPTTLVALLNTTKGIFGICPYQRAAKDSTSARRVSVRETLRSSVRQPTHSARYARSICGWMGQSCAAGPHLGHARLFDWAGTLRGGRHTHYAHDVDNTVQRYDFTFELPAGH